MSQNGYGYIPGRIHVSLIDMQSEWFIKLLINPVVNFGDQDNSEVNEFTPELALQRAMSFEAPRATVRLVVEAFVKAHR